MNGIRFTKAQTRRLAVGAACALALLATACGGGGDSGDASLPATSTPAAATIGSSGGSVAGPAGASVDVPTGAFDAATTVSIAMDSTGAPALPEGLTAVGNTYTITPHGGSFGELVTLRIPTPQVTLRDNEQLMLAKAQPGGSWEVLGDTTVVDGMLTAQVQSFSYVTPVVVVYPITLQVLAPFAATVTLTCNGGSCQQLAVPPTIRVLITTNGGQLPAQCQSGVARIVVTARGSLSTVVQLFSVTITSATSYETTVGPILSEGTGYAPRWSLECINGTAKTTNITPRISFSSGQYGGDRPLLALAAPPALEALPNGPVMLSTVFTGGAAQSTATNGPFSAPTSSNQTVIEWLRSRDGGVSWTPLGQSFEIDADPQPYPLPVPARRYWKSSFQYPAASPEDQNALFRAHACYTPPRSAVPQCATGPSSRLTVLVNSAVPVITEAPRSVLVQSGQSASLTVVADGAPTPTLQWQTRAANATGAWADIAAANGNSFSTTALGTAANGTQYRVVATNTVGTAESTIAIVSVSDLAVAPSFTTQPSSLTVNSGSDATFAVAVHGTESLSYQWRFNGNPIAGANSAVLKLPAVDATNAGGYSILVSNSAGSATSSAATLTVTPATTRPPTIVTQPVSVLVNAGTNATFDVLASAPDNLVVRWERKEPGGSAFATVPGAAPITGGSRLGVTAVLADSGATYRAQVCNSLQGADYCIYTSPATLTVTSLSPPPGALAATSRLSGAYQSVCGIAATGGVLCWGANNSGELGRGSNQPAEGIPAAVIGLTGVTSVGSSRSTSCAVHGGGCLSCWGFPVLGQGGASSVPVERVGVTDARLVRVTTAEVCTVDGDRRIRCNGSTQPLQIDGHVVEDAIDFAFLPAGRCVLLGSGEARCAMFDGSGALNTSLVVPMVRSLTAPGVNGIGTPFCLVLQSGSVHCWGTNANGQLGRGDGDLSVTDGTIPGIGPALQVAVGTQHACALVADGTVSCWGSGYLGNGAGFEVTQAPRVVNGLTGIVEISAGYDTTCALRSDGAVLCWGDNASGSVGAGTPGAPVLVPTPTVAGAVFMH